MREVVEVAVEQLTPALNRKSHRIEVALPQIPCVIDGDRTRLIQVISNQLANSIRYTPAGGEITVVLQANETNLNVEVRDNGVGISSALLPHLFDIYVQAERSSVMRDAGLGLGLVKSLVDIHHGTVLVTSDGEGQGNASTIVLPLTRRNDVAVLSNGSNSAAG